VPLASARALNPGLLILVLLGAGRRLFEVLPLPITLEIIRAIGTPEATHIPARKDPKGLAEPCQGACQNNCGYVGWR
jgi:hypothetical protein